MIMKASDVTAISSYTQDDIQQILHLALTKQSANGDLEFSHQQLVEIAEEMNIGLDTLQSAKKEWLTSQSSNQQRGEFDRHRQQKFKKGLGNYAIVNFFLVGINVFALGGPGFLWSLYILGFWGMGVALRGWNSYHLTGEDYNQQFQKWNSSRKIRQSVHSLIAKVLPK
jgi:2TM domain